MTKEQIIEDLESLIQHNEDDFDRGKGKYILREYIDELKEEEKQKFNCKFTSECMNYKTIHCDNNMEKEFKEDTVNIILNEMFTEGRKTLSQSEFDEITKKYAKRIVKLFAIPVVRLSLPDSEIKKFCDAVETQEAKLISPTKMVWYKLGIKQGLKSFGMLYKDYVKGK